MDSKVVKELLDRYFAGETTLEEETQLRRYFRRSTIDPQFESLRPLFQFFQEEAQLQAPQSWKPPGTAFRSMLRVIRPVSIAALIVLAFGLWWLVGRDGTPEPTAQINWEHYEVNDPEAAARIIADALKKAGTTINEGATHAVREMEAVERLSNPIY